MKKDNVMNHAAEESEKAEDAAGVVDKYNASLTKVLELVCSRNGVSQARFAREIRWTQSAINTVLKGKRKWSLELLVAFARWMGVPPSDILHLAERDMDGEDIMLEKAVSGTEPRSDERLTALMRYAYGPAQPELLDFYVCAQLLAIAVPKLYAAYRDGGIADSAMYALLKGAMDEASPGEEGKNFYVILKENMKG